MQKFVTRHNDSDGFFSYMHTITEHPQFKEFSLHTHNDYEIYIFLKGDITFTVEGISKKMSPYDMILIKGNELHQLFPNPDCEYERIVMNISDSFFSKWHCDYIRKIFSGNTASRFISGDIFRSYDLDEDIKRIEKNIREHPTDNDTAIKCSLIELLHNISRISSENKKEEYGSIHEILKYINDNITQPLALDELAEHFFLSKYYLCRVFKKTTGFTVNQYIVMKRLLLVKQLCRKGISLTVASSEAGFKDYVTFYRAYTKEFGVSPKHGLKNK